MIARNAIELKLPRESKHNWVKLGFGQVDTNDLIRTEFLNSFNSAIDEVVAGKINNATARLSIKQALNAKGFWPNPKSDDPDKWLNTILDANIRIRQYIRYG